MAESKGIRRQKGQRQEKQGPKGKNYLFVMGIDEYEHVPRLSNAVKDAEDLIAILTDKYQFDTENIVPLFNEKATISNIHKELIALTAKVTSQDKLIIYFSGHGYFDKSDNTGHLVPVNAKRDAVWEYLSNANLLNRIRAINSFHTLLIVDSCFSGSLFATKNMDSTALAETVERFPSRWGLAAGRIELVEDGMRGDNSPFAKSVLSFLKANVAPKFPASDLIQHVKRVTRHNAAQTPVGGPLFRVGDVGGEFVFHLRESGVTEWETAWQKIQDTAEKEEREITYKIRLLHDYVNDFELADNYDAALELGEKLEHKRDFFRAKGSLFKMRKFVREKTPFQQEARLLLAEMQKREKEAREEMDAERKKDQQQQKETEKQRLLQEEAKAWEQASSAHTIEAYEAYQKAFSSGSKVNEAEKQIIGLKEKMQKVKQQQKETEKQRLLQEEAKAWEQASSAHTIEAYEAYQKAFSNGSKVNEAEKQIIGLKEKMQEVKQAEKETTIWEAASKKNIIKAYQAYLKAYPSGKYCTEAEKRIKGIRQKRQKRKRELIKPPGIITEKNSSSDTFTDPRDGQTYRTVELNGRTWMAENLNYDVGYGCWFYEKSTGFLGLGKKEIVEEYGRLYTWEAAKKACPPGWRLPTDRQWKALAKAFGGYYDRDTVEDIGDPQKAYQALMQGGPSGFEAVLGGWRNSDGSCYDLGSSGNYWSRSRTELGAVVAWYYNFNGGELNRFNNLSFIGCSCRCLKD